MGYARLLRHVVCEPAIGFYGSKRIQKLTQQEARELELRGEQEIVHAVGGRAGGRGGGVGRAVEGVGRMLGVGRIDGRLALLHEGIGTRSTYGRYRRRARLTKRVWVVGQDAT